MSEPDYVARNRALWTTKNAEYTDPDALRAWSDTEFKWGVFGVPEHELGVLGDVTGLDVIELGCGQPSSPHDSRDSAHVRLE